VDTGIAGALGHRTVAIPLGLPLRTGAVGSANVLGRPSRTGVRRSAGRRTARKIAEIAAGGNGMTRIEATGTGAAMTATEAIAGRRATTPTTGAGEMSDPTGAEGD
jgi:hypothetical protein